MPILKIMQGLPAAGKSTAAKEMCDQTGTVRINFDLLREMLFFGQWSKENEKLVHSIAKVVADEIFKAGRDCVMDNTNLSKSQKDLNDSIASKNGVEQKIYDFTWVPVDECISRDARRGDNAVGEPTIREMWNKFVRQPSGSVEYDPSLPDCIICDIDGTIAERVTDRNPYGGDRVYEDAVRLPVAEVIHALMETDRDLMLIFASGREDKGACRNETGRWIEDKAEFYDFIILMRKENDGRKDYIVKREMYEEHIKGKYNVIAVFDDRASVVRMWDDLGLGDRLFRVGRIDADNF